jgi:hypothetical protein
VLWSYCKGAALRLKVAAKPNALANIQNFAASWNIRLANFHPLSAAAKNAKADLEEENRAAQIW